MVEKTRTTSAAGVGNKVFFSFSIVTQDATTSGSEGYKHQQAYKTVQAETSHFLQE